MAKVYPLSEANHSQLIFTKVFDFLGLGLPLSAIGVVWERVLSNMGNPRSHPRDYCILLEQSGIEVWYFDILYEPSIRAYLLCDVILDCCILLNIKSKAQHKKQKNLNYYIIHPVLKHVNVSYFRDPE